MKSLIVVILLLFVCQMSYSCTIGVASGKATKDGRPLLWKNRDYGSEPNNRVGYNTLFGLNYVCVYTSEQSSSTSSTMGVNEQGFAIINSMVYDLQEGSNLGASNLMVISNALQNCETVQGFIDYLETTNNAWPGRNTRANFGVIDRLGNAAIIEASADSFWVYDANDTTIAPDGYIVRANFSIQGGGTAGLNRYNASKINLNVLYSENNITAKSLMKYQIRSFADNNAYPITVPYNDNWYNFTPYGYIKTENCINKYSTVSAAVIQGILPNENPILTTMYAMLGQPSTTIAAPYWAIGNKSELAAASPAPLCDVALNIKAKLFDYDMGADYIDSFKLRDDNGEGHWDMTFFAEDSIFDVTDSILTIMRNEQNPDLNILLDFEHDITEYVYRKLLGGLNSLNTTHYYNCNVKNNIEVYPNPTRDFVCINNLPKNAEVFVYDMSNKCLKKSVIQNDIVMLDDCMPGVYFLIIKSSENIYNQKIIKL